MNNALKVMFVLLVSLCILSSAEQPYNVFLLSFDNFYRDAEIDWLRIGFVEFIQDYLNNNLRVNAQRTEKIEATLNQLKTRPDFKTLKNYLLTGSYYRQDGKFFVKIELTDLTTWKPIGTRQIESTTADFGKIVEQVNQAVGELLGLIRPTQLEEKAAPETALTPDSLQKAIDQSLASFRAASTATQKFSFAIEQLDQKLQLSQGSSSQAVRPLKFTSQVSSEFGKQLEESLQRSADFNSIVGYIIQNPYEIEISEPNLQRVPTRDDLINLNFDVIYRLRRTVIKEMLETLPYKDKREYSNYVEYLFSGDKIIFDAELRQRIMRGEYRSFPVITLTSNQGAPLYRIFDLPAIITRSLPTLANVQYIHRFTPRFSLSASSWDVKVWLYNDDLKLSYSIQIGLNELSKVREITVTILPEKEALQILGINP
jgi:TolB-like protein